MKLKIQLYKCFHLNVTSFWFGLRVSVEPSKLQASAWHRILLQYSGTESYRTSSDKHMSVVTHLLIIFFVYLYCKAYIVTEYRILKKQTHLSIINLFIFLFVGTSCTVTTYMYCKSQRKNLNLVNPFKGIFLFPHIYGSVCSVPIFYMEMGYKET